MMARGKFFGGVQVKTLLCKGSIALALAALCSALAPAMTPPLKSPVVARQAAAPAAAPGQIAAVPAGDPDKTLAALHDELQRSRDRLVLPGQDRPYYIQYRLL